MIVYAIVILIILVLRFNLDNIRVGSPDYDDETKFLKIICGILVVLAGVRGRAVGADTAGYIFDYSAEAILPLKQVIQKHGSIGAGYFFFSKIFSMTGLSVHWWFGVVALFYVSAIYQFIQRYSQDKLLSILCFFTIGLYSFSLAGLKQTLSMGFTIFAFIALSDRRYIMFAGLGLLAFWCHSAAAIFAFGLLCYFFRNQRLFFLYLFFFLMAVILWGDSLWVNTIKLLNDEHYSELYASADNIYSAWTFVFYLLLLFLMIFPLRKYLEDSPNECKVLYGMTLIAIAFQSLATSFSTAFRVAYYYLPFLIVLIPNCCSHFRNYRNKKIWKISLCLICVFWCLYTGRDNSFTFFWTD